MGTVKFPGKNKDKPVWLLHGKTVPLQNSLSILSNSRYNKQGGQLGLSEGSQEAVKKAGKHKVTRKVPSRIRSRIQDMKQKDGINSQFSLCEG